MKNKLSYLCICITAFVFSLMEITLKISSRSTVGLNGIQISFWRFFIAAVCFAPFIINQIRKYHIKFTLKDWQFFFTTGFVFIVFCMSLYQISCKLEPAAIAAIIFSCNPVFVLLFSKIILKKHFSSQEIGLLLLSLTGLAFILNPFSQLQVLNWQGIIISLLSSASFGLYTVLSKKYLLSNRSSGFIVSGMSFICGLIELLLFIGGSHLLLVSTFFEQIPSLNILASIPIFHGITSQNIGLLLFIGIIITAIGYGCYFYAVEHVGSFIASSAFFIKSILSPIFAVIILHEQLHLTAIIGSILIVSGLSLPFISTRKQVDSNEE